MEKGFFEYKVEWFDEFNTDEKHPHGQLVISKGVCYASTYAKAVKKIEKDYSMIENITINGLEPSFCFDIKHDPYKLDGEVLKGGKY